MRAALPSTTSSLGLAERVAENQRSPRPSVAARCGFGPIICSLALVGAFVGATPLPAQESTAAETRVSDSEPLLQLQLPKAQAGVLFQAWTRANNDLENGRSAEARRGFATVLTLLDEVESKPARRERAMLAKAHLHARVLGDRVAARQELGRVLALNPKSTEALALEDRLKAEERKPQTAPEIPAPPVEFAPRLGLRKEGKP